MDELLIQALRGSFSPEQSQREEAEAFLLKTEQVPGYLEALVKIWVNPAVCTWSMRSIQISHLG